MAYGMTELSPLATVTAPLDTLERKLNTVGRAIPHCSIKVVAPDDPSKTLRTGEKGEIIASGYLVMAGYWKDETRTKEAIFEELHEGRITRWMRTGDEAMIDEDGYVQITGRIKDIIIRGGENIYPVEIETCLLHHPKVTAAAVVGLPDPKLGEVLAAFLVLSPDVEVSEGACGVDLRDSECIDASSMETTQITPGMIRDHVQAHLAKHLVPKYVFWVSKMPLTSSGKLEKYRLRDKALKALK